MPLEPPRWWYRPKPGLAARTLQPLGALVDGIARLRTDLTTPARVSVPVLCIGNFTVGGAGKTPLALHVAEYVGNRGVRPFFLSRGHGGRETGPLRVDRDRHTAFEVGDEPLMLARHAPTIIARDRPAGAALAEAEGADVIIMDDGFQNPSLAKDLTLVAVDAARGVGNRLVMPAGPLRASLAFQMKRVDALVVITGAGAPPKAELPGDAFARGFGGPVIHGRSVPAVRADWIQGARIVAFTGIGRPSKLFETLAALGADLVETRAFADHHVFTEYEAGALLDLARAFDAQLVTTEKDHVRLSEGRGRLGALHERAWPLPIKLTFARDDAAQLTTLLDIALSIVTVEA